MPRRIVVPLDGSNVSECALPFARGLAHSSGVAVSLLTVADAPGSLPEPTAGTEPDASSEPWDNPTAMRGALPTAPGTSTRAPSDDELEEVTERSEDAEAYLQRVATTFEDTPVETRVQYGDPATHIVDFTSRRALASGEGIAEDCAVVMATHGRTGLGRVLLGSVTWSVVKSGSFPVFLVPGRDEDDASSDSAQIEQVLVALDGSSFSEQILQAYRTWLADTVQSAHLITVTDPPPSSLDQDIAPTDDQGRTEEDRARRYLSHVATSLEAEGMQVTWEVAQGDVVETITSVADAINADLIALATHSRTGLTRLRVGSVAEKLLQQRSRPLLLVHPDQGDSE